MILRKNWLYVYTDGSSLPKPRRGGIGIRYVYLNEKEEEFRIDGYEFGFSSATNNQMELKAVIEGLKGIRNLNIPMRYNNIEVRTDLYILIEKYTTFSLKSIPLIMLNQLLWERKSNTKTDDKYGYETGDYKAVFS
ncbi:MAG: hypothetical protein GX465_17140 [Acidobacteria bacterium]|nr:hypothetical protein [Acidobacteriota bacterium]